MRAIYDAAVIGGGPAGSTVALCLARRGWKVCLFEATDYSDERYGETLPPEVNPLLRELGLYEEFLTISPLESPGIVSVWGSALPSEQDFVRNPYGPGWHVDRNRFDEMLYMRAAAAGTECFRAGRAKLDERNGGLWWIGDTGARFLVDASGRNGLRIDGDGARENEDRMLAIILRLKQASAAPDRRTLIEAAPAGWWYSAGLPHGETIAMFFTDRDIYMREGIVLEEQLFEAPRMRGRLKNSVLKASRTVDATSSFRKTIAGEGWLAAGDSASSYDPLSGRGIFNALRQGVNAGTAADAYLRGDRERLAEYAAVVRKEFDSYVVERRKHYAAERRWAGLEFWSRRSGLINAVKCASLRNPELPQFLV